MKRFVVTRGPTEDVGEWVEVGGGDPHAGGHATSAPGAHTYPTVGGDRGSPQLIALVAIITLVAAVLTFVEVEAPPREITVTRTIADLSTVHAGVTVENRAASRSAEAADGTARLREGDAVTTDADGRARIRLDGGATVLIDRNSRVVLGAASALLEKGRAFVDAPAGARVEARVGGASAPLTGTKAALEATDRATSLFVSHGEATLAKDGKETVVHGGETASIGAKSVEVKPERNFDDWTVGLTAPWSSGGAPRRTLAEATGRNMDGTGSAALATRSVEVRAVVHGEAAETRVTTTFFNAGDAVQVADVKLAIPPGAIVSGFAVMRDGTRNVGFPALASRTNTSVVPPLDVLEWAGESWVRASIPGVAPGQTVAVEVAFIGWLQATPSASGAQRRVEYRFPMADGRERDPIGELSIQVDASAARPLAMAVPTGAVTRGDVVSYAASDAKPSSDFVVGFDLPRAEAPARAFIAPPGPDDDGAETILVRTEAPAPRASKAAGSPAGGGIDVVVVLDRSSSVEPAMLEAGRAFALALIDALGPRDRVAMVRSDAQVAAVGPADFGPADDARRKAIRDALAEPLVPAGATDLGAALEAAADKLPADAPAGLVIYVGDGWPTWGDLGAEAIRGRLARRDRGAPRLGAVALGPTSNRVGLAALVRGTGPLFEVADGLDAARAATDLLATSVGPAIADLTVDLGPRVERVYPRTAMALRAGESFTIVGKLRGAPPASIRLRYRDPQGEVATERAVVAVDASLPQDVRRRWAAARVEAIALAGQGRESATHVAYGAGLLTPWTALGVSGARQAIGQQATEYAASPLGARILDLSTDVGFGAAFATTSDRSGVIGSPEDDAARDAPIELALSRAGGRVLDDARSSLRACRDARAALRPTIGRQFTIRLSLDGDGRATKVTVLGQGVDAELERCMSAVVVGLAYPASDEAKDIEIEHMVTLPDLEVGKRRTCSALSRLPVPQRRGAWQLAISREGALQTFLTARRSCELGSWTAQRSLLELVILSLGDLTQAAPLAVQLENEGEIEAAGLLRREAMRRARSAEEIRRLRGALLANENLPLVRFLEAYGKANDDAGRLRVVARFLAFAPHDRRLLDRLLALSVKDPEKLRLTARRILDDAYSDAALVASVGEALHASGDAEGSRRAFEEIIERSPRDPWARAYAGDRLRALGEDEKAAAIYASLETLDPDEPAAVLRSAIAHADAGRTDLALRILGRIARTGGRTANADLARLSGALAHVVVREALAKPDLAADQKALLERSLAELPRPTTGGGVLLVTADGGGPPLSLDLVRGPDKAREHRAPIASAPSIGLWLFDLGPGDLDDAVLRLARPGALAPGAELKTRGYVIVDPSKAELHAFDAGLPLDGGWMRGAVAKDGAVAAFTKEK